ncbi:MAG: hypothetical protein DBY16_03020 [Coprobacter sp.]|jgi:putative pirin-like protein|nr:pirin family protein [Barnesiella sp. GGCC_0306]MBS7040656.1 pirin family protein [Bacteroidales bacterium]PWM92473.1 MAG: hypothetical protein DBY16_03020 [Coprobacter sp.]
MKSIIDKAESRGHANHGWLDTHHTFSFANYYNPRRMSFGALRVLNDDKVAPGTGFDTHPHENMEIVSIPLKGHLSHGDSESNQKVITVGEIQVMSAGTGILHSEKNHSQTEPVEFLQIWVIPKHKNNRPKYNDYDIRELLLPNQWALFISPDGDAPASIDQDAWFSMGDFDAGKIIDYTLHKDNTGIYLFVLEGEIAIGDAILSRRDGIGLYETKQIQIKVLKKAKLLLMEVPIL